MQEITKMFILHGLHIFYLLVFHLAACQHTEELHLSGPLQDMTFSVQEGTIGFQYLYQFIIEPPADSLRLSGETDGIFEIGPKQGILYFNKTLDRETKAVYKLQVNAVDAKGEKVKGPYIITVNVQDINDNQPQFDQEKYFGVVRPLPSRAGKPFMYVHATDFDDPTTPNAQLSYSIFQHFPNPYNVMLFEINNKTGGIATSPQGARLLDPQKQDHFTLVVTVKDLAGMTGNAFTNNADVEITVKENLWKAPPPVHIRENYLGPYPNNITQVQWNDPDAKYELLPKERLPRFPFTINKNGTIYVTEPLDREEKDFYTFYATAKDEQGEILDKPLEIQIVVEDVNDNPPVCQKALTIFEVQENENVGSIIGTLEASDMDQQGTLNSRLQFHIVDQNPKIPVDKLFIVQQEAGTFQLRSSSLNKHIVSNYTLKVEVTDAGFKTECDVQINIIDINDQIPIFEKSDYGNVTIPEDTPIGNVIQEIQATDVDEPFTGSSQIIYQIEEGDPGKNFFIETDPKTNRGFIKIQKALDFEKTPMYNLTIKATNPEPLVSGVQYRSNSTAYFRVIVTDVNEPPVFRQLTYITAVYEDTPVNTWVMKAEAYDPEGDEIRYTLKNNNRKWLRIDEISGDIYIASHLDRETERAYRVEVTAIQTSKESQSSTAIFILHIRDVNDNAPRLARNYSLFFCHPLSGGEGAQIEATDDDEHDPEFTFSIEGDENIKRNWGISRINGTHVYLYPKSTDLEAKMHNIPLKIKDKGEPPLERNLNLQVNICRCTDARTCFIELAHNSQSPSVGMAVGILLAVAIVVGGILGGVFFHLNRKKKKERKEADQNAKNPAEMIALTS
ncbi:cadherin-17 [Alligator mississippiensis]|nr:cadherin-17 [Alligator mississippiensis]